MVTNLVKLLLFLAFGGFIIAIQVAYHFILRVVISYFIIYGIILCYLNKIMFE